MKKKSKLEIHEDILNSLMNEIPETYFITQGIPAIIQGDQILLRPVYGLNLFLSSWMEQEKGNQFLNKDIVEFLENTSDYIDYAHKILKFMHNKGRIPEKDEAWEMDIPIEAMDLVLDLINVKVQEINFEDLTLKEQKYYDNLSKPIIHSQKKLKEFKLEELISDHELNLIDAKILPNFINSLLNLGNITELISNYLNLRDLTEDYEEKLNKIATQLIKTEILEKKDISLLGLSQKLNASILETGEALFYLENSMKITPIQFSEEKIGKLSKFLTKALKYCRKNDQELNSTLLIKKFNLDLKKANEIIKLYGMKFILSRRLSRKEKRRYDQISHSVIKYIKEVKEDPTIDDLMLNLNLNIKDANLIFTFINNVVSKPLKENFEKFPEKVLLKLDDIACQILNINKNREKEIELLDLAYQLNEGIYSTKLALNYITWLEDKIDQKYIQSLPPEDKEIIEDKIKSALSYIKEHDLDLDFGVLIEEVGFNLRDTHHIIGLYNEIISKKLNFDRLSENNKKQLEDVARKIYKAKKRGEIESYDPEEVLTLKPKSFKLGYIYQGLVYLKVKVLDQLVGETKKIKTETGRISAEGSIQLNEKLGTKIGERKGIQLAKETLKLEETKVHFKSASDKVQLKRGIDFVGGLIRYKVAIKNNTDMLINNIEVSLQMTAEHIRIIDIKPRVYKRDNRARISSMSPEQSESIDFYLEPMICGSIPVSPVATYVDAFGNPQMSAREKLMVTSKCPPIINPGEENIAKVRHIYESKDIIRTFRSFELDHDPRRTFEVLQEAIGAWAGKPVSKPIIGNPEPFSAEIYYYVLNQNKDSELGHQEQIIIKLQVDEEKNVAMLHIGAEKNTTVNGVLTHIWQLANAKFGEVFGYKFESLHCPECGGSLDNLRANQEFIICKYCNEKIQKKAL